MLFIKFTFRMKQKYKLSYGQIFPGLAGLGVSDSICLKNNLCFEVSSFARLSPQPNFSQRQAPDKCVFNLPRLLPLLAPSSVAMKVALQQQCGVANSHGLRFCTQPASILHDFFYNDSIKRRLAEAHRICAHSGNL